MAVQIIENWADVRGRVTFVRAASEPEVAIVGVAVDAADDVAGFRNLMRRHVGSEIHIRVPKDILRRLPLQPQAEVTIRVSAGGLESFFLDPKNVRIGHPTTP